MYVLNEYFLHDKTDLYVWGKTVTSRGSEEVASCCPKHIQNIETQDRILHTVTCITDKTET